MRISSPVFENNTMLPSLYSCDGKGINPPLTFSDVPDETKSLVLIVDDPDAPIGTFTHWVVYNIPFLTTGIAENSVPPESVEGKTSLNKPGFIGACPPSGTHRYFFKLYALDMALPLQEMLGRKELESAMQEHILASSELIGLYKRQ